MAGAAEGWAAAPPLLPNTVCGKVARCRAAGVSGRVKGPLCPQAESAAAPASISPETRMIRRGNNDMGRNCNDRL
jgi:hypothetical protein